MKTMFKTIVGVAGLAVAMQSAAEVTFFEREGFRGRSFNVDRPIRDLERAGYNDRASSAVVQSGEWQVCEDASFGGRCAVLRPGEYPSLSAMGLNNEISSVRAVEGRQAYGRDDSGRGDRGYGAAQRDDRAQRQDYRRRGDERLFEAQVTSVRAVVGPPEQRCWVERQQLVGGPDRGDPNVPGAIVGGVLGGILGHQIGSGRGNDVATIGGAIAGAALGANTNRGDVQTRDVQRCASVPRDARPDFYDVEYTFRGQTHHVQMATPPGPTILVNRDGEPRV